MSSARIYKLRQCQLSYAAKTLEGWVVNDFSFPVIIGDEPMNRISNKKVWHFIAFDPS